MQAVFNWSDMSSIGTGLSNRELEEMREAVEPLFPDVCNILTVTKAANGYGGITETWGTASSNVSCRLDAKSSAGMSGKEGVAGLSLIPFQSMVISLVYDQALTTAQRIEHGGNTYNITGVNSDVSWRVVKRASVELT